MLSKALHPGQHFLSGETSKQRKRSELLEFTCLECKTFLAIACHFIHGLILQWIKQFPNILQNVACPLYTILENISQCFTLFFNIFIIYLISNAKLLWLVCAIVLYFLYGLMLYWITQLTSCCTSTPCSFTLLFKYIIKHDWTPTHNIAWGKAILHADMTKCRSAIYLKSYHLISFHRAQQYYSRED